MEFDIGKIFELSQFRDRICNEGAVEFRRVPGADRGGQTGLDAARDRCFGEQDHDGPHPKIVNYLLLSSAGDTLSYESIDTCYRLPGAGLGVDARFRRGQEGR